MRRPLSWGFPGNLWLFLPSRGDFLQRSIWFIFSFVLFLWPLIVLISMAEGLQELWNKFTLLELEGSEVVVDDSDVVAPKTCPCWANHPETYGWG